MTYTDTTIDVMNEKSGFIRPDNSLPLIHGPVSMFLTVGVVDDDVWSTDAHKSDVCCTVPYPTVSAELCVPKHLRLDLHCIGLAAEPLSGADFALPSRTVSRVAIIFAVSVSLTFPGFIKNFPDFFRR
ncbi:hypothetical protein AVEN_145727-1 [Araneus ventricosus]|uniref:Uncharacterized protein n=1 Tax=Araneus ventricosus TaxID=182803 RepID=A0A4Y2M6R4_ARAVE|nr:hypothetical protein AVEN_145727-1 [Araneus ventricosus]